VKDALRIRAVPGVLFGAVLLVATCGVAGAQPGSTAGATTPFTVRGFADVGATVFTASRSFKAILGSSSGTVYGGGIEVVERHNIFVSFRASRFRENGERVFVVNQTVTKLGIPATVTITPLELTGGYRFTFVGMRLIPYAGGGVGWHRYEETSRFATAEENVKETFTGYHVLGGVEYRIFRWVAASGEAQWGSVPDALGNDANSVGHEFGEHDLGGGTFRAKIVIGR
jgi:opacity protein-like surface antigen